MSDSTAKKQRRSPRGGSQNQPSNNRGDAVAPVWGERERLAFRSAEQARAREAGRLAARAVFEGRPWGEGDVFTDDTRWYSGHQLHAAAFFSAARTELLSAIGTPCGQAHSDTIVQGQLERLVARYAAEHPGFVEAYPGDLTTATIRATLEFILAAETRRRELARKTSGELALRPLARASQNPGPVAPAKLSG